jgi:UDP-glucuronate 4-epimerase
VNVLLTGAAGFVGWKTTCQLLAQGHRVLGIDNLNTYYTPRLKQWRLQTLGVRADLESLTSGRVIESADSDFSFQCLDIEHGERIQALFKDNSFDAVINLAARAGVRESIEDPHLYFRTNVMGSVNLLEAMQRHGISRYVLASTSSLYAGHPLPFREDAPVNNPISPYAATKKAAEAAAHAWHHLYGMDIGIVRYFTVYGPAGRPDMSPIVFLRCIDRGEPIPLFGDGTQRRDFTYIDDVARGTVRVLDESGYGLFNLGGGNEPVSLLQMIAIFEEELGRPAILDKQPFNVADMQETQADATRAREVLGWEATVAPEEGFRRTAAWWKSTGRTLL